MTNEERICKIEEKVDKIHEIVSSVVPMIKEHRTTLYGNGKEGLKEEFAILKQKQEDCPARIAQTMSGKALEISNKRLIISNIVAVIGIISLIMTSVIGILNYISE